MPERIRKGGTHPPGFLGLEILRAFIEKRRTNITALLGAFRGQCARPTHRMSGMGSWTGPLNIESGSARLTLGQFRSALMELNITLPPTESQAIFNVMSVNGTVSVSDLMREIRAEPCERSARWGREGVGNEYMPNREAMMNAIVLPTPISGYTQGPHRIMRPQSAAVTRAELTKLKEQWAGRIAPTQTSGYAGSVKYTNDLIKQIGGDAKPVKPAPKAVDDGSEASSLYRSRPRSAYGTIYASTPGLLHSQEEDPDHWVRDGIGRSKLKPVEVFGRPAPTEGSGYSRDQGQLDLSQPWVEKPKPAMAWRMADNKYPWTSGYNRGLRANYVPDEPDENGWSREGIGRKPPAMALLDPNVKVEPTRHSGYHQMCSLDEAAKAQKERLCAWCRVID